MFRNIIKKYMFFCIIILVINLVFIPAFSASTLPDLIVEKIGFAPDENGMQKIAFITIKNIGEAKALDALVFRYTFIRMAFGLIPIQIVRTNTETIKQYGGLDPQETIDFLLMYEYELPKFGFFRFSCTVNPGKTMEESNYDNNDLSQKYIAILSHWILIG